MAVGDGVLSQADHKLQMYRLAVVKKLHPDERDKVRTGTLLLLDRRKRGSIPEARSVRMVVQRLAVVWPVEEKWEAGLARILN